MVDGLLLQPTCSFLRNSNLLLLGCVGGGGAFGRGSAMADGVFTPPLNNGVHFLHNNVSMHLEWMGYLHQHSTMEYISIKIMSVRIWSEHHIELETVMYLFI
eukprot:TRINITY_DN12370_c1_g1_i1.p1 TRINITY_DN12370_c1_g1~~TRINITY_DN12370_c1_g1_i1.p1  ORF type:complete len:102 (-),score=10.54 TRINITY_DN12370_c1_g1_i1:1195-1500(-)